MHIQTSFGLNLQFLMVVTILSKLQFREHYADGTVKVSTPDLGFFASVYVLALKYDPDAYNQIKYNVDARKSEGMDATGPFSWKFYRKLPDTEAQRQCSSPGFRHFWPELLWVESIFME